jgi:RNA polymerase sigma factor (sigma-70 family)
MGNRQADGLLQGLCRLAEAQAAELTDRQLLNRFATYRDEAAFAALLQRHGGLVYGVCRHILRHDQDAEDAFQGTFLVLARQAAAIRDEKALASWLYRVAYRVATKARTAAERRRGRENETAKPPEDRSVSDLAWRELQAILDEELNRLPEKYRSPFVLCCLTGMSKSEAAAELGWKEGTVSSRLAHARKLLQSRLARRGVALSAVLSGLAVAKDGAAAAVPAGLVATTRKSAPAFAAGEAPAAGAASAPATLAGAALRGMALGRLKLPAAILILVVLVGSAAAVVLHHPPPAPPPETPETRNFVHAAAPTPPPPKDGPGAPAIVRKMTVTGSVVDPDRNALPGARIAVIADLHPRPGDVLYRSQTQVLGEGQADAQGLFRLSVPQTTHMYSRLTVYASAPGFATSTRTAEPYTVTAPEHDLSVRLIRGHTVRGRLLTSDGKPAGGVQLHVVGMDRAGSSNASVMLVVYHEPPVPLPGWPDPVTTDDEGNFTLQNIGPDSKLFLQVRDERFGTQALRLRTGLIERTKPLVLTLSPPRTLEGRVAAEDTGQPLADAAVIVESLDPVAEPTSGSFAGTVAGRTDPDGRYRVRPFPAGDRIRMWVYPPSGQPYLALEQHLTWPAGAASHRADLPVPRGILIRGTVTEAGSDRPVSGAAVTHEWGYKRNPFQDPARDRRGTWWKTRDTKTGPDGTFAIAVPPGPGLLLIKAAEPDFVHVEVGSEVANGGTGGIAYFPDAFVPLQLQPTDAVQELALQVRRGVTLCGRVVGHDGKPVASALLFYPTYVPEGLEVKGYSLLVQNGRFEVPGCEPGGKAAVWVYDPEGKQGAVAELAVGGGTEPEVRLAPCVSARLRVADAAGKPVAGPRIQLELILRPGDDRNTAVQKGTRAVISVYDAHLYGRNYKPAEAGAGNFTLPDLIPGATYAVRAVGTGGWAGGWSERVLFTVPQTGPLDLGALTVRLPQRRN